MNLSEFKNILQTKTKISFELPSGQTVPSHFHVTEVGHVTKKFIDCGGVKREEESISLQLWEANDYDHQLHPEKLIAILELSEKELQLKNLEIEVEYQGSTIGKYGLDYKGQHFLLTNKTTDCLAPDKCGVRASKPKISLKTLQSNTCEPGSGCC